MSKMCDLCQRKPQMGHTRSHSNIATKKRMMLNLQSRRIGNQKMLVCTSCLKKIKRDMAVAKA